MGLIVAYRNREEHLKKFIPHMQKFLKDFPYHLFIIEQTQEKLFNKGMLLNTGFKLAKPTCDYVCLHDVDMLPLSADYSYPKSPTRLATHVEQFDFDMPYPQFFGGVVLFNNKDFETINGYCNAYWSWGCEDDDVRIRCQNKKLAIETREGTFLSLPHERHPENSTVRANREICEEFLYGNTELQKEGLNTVNFEIVSEQHDNNFSHYTIRI